jgi:hypothetical protein
VFCCCFGDHRLPKTNEASSPEQVHAHAQFSTVSGSLLTTLPRYNYGIHRSNYFKNHALILHGVSFHVVLPNDLSVFGDCYSQYLTMWSLEQPLEEEHSTLLEGIGLKHCQIYIVVT